MRRLSQRGGGGFWLRTIAAGVTGMLLLVSPALRAQSAEPARANDRPVREIYVPIGDLDVLLGGDAERVFVTREEYQDLLARTRQPEPSPPAARDVVVLSADYDVALSGERAVLSGRLQIDVLTAGLQAVSIPLEGVGLRTAILDDAAAVLGRDEAGVAQLFLEGLGRHELVIEATMPVVTSAAQQAVTFRVPTPAATRLRVSVPGNVEIRSGVLSREFDAAAGVTRFEVPPARGSQQLVMSLNNRTQALQRVVTARSVLVDEVTQGYRRLHATVSLRVLRGAAPSFSFRLPADLEVTDVAAPQVSQWRVFDTDSGRVLEVQLHEPTADLVTLAITATGSRLGPGPWVMQQIEPLEVASHVALLGLLLDERLEAQRLEAVGAFPIDVSVLRQAVPASVYAAESSAPQIRPVAAWLAAEEAVTITAELTRPEEAVEVKVATLLSLEDQQQRLRSTITLRPQAEPIQAITLRVPAGWDVTRVLAAENTPLAFTPAIGGEPGDIRVRFAQQLPEGASARLTVEAESVPAEWLTDWQEQTVAFPMLTVAGGTFLEGAVAVTAGGDLAVRPAELDGLIPLARREREEAGLSADEGTFAYRVVTAEQDARLTVTRRQPQLTARTFTFAKIGNEAVSIHAELLYDINRAATRQLSFRLPRETPSVISLRGLGGVVVSEFSSREDGDTRVWTAELADRARGRAGLAVDFQQPLSVGPRPRPLPLPCVAAEGVAYQSSAVAVEGHPEIDVSLASAGRRIDVGELVDAEYQVGRRLLGVFGFVGTAEVTATIARRAGYPLPEAIVQRAELVTLQGATGAAQTAARLLLRTNAAFLQVTLPSGASLWSVSIDGRPSLPQRDGDGVLVSLSSSINEAGVRDLSIVYETESPGATWWQEVAHEPPKLAVRDESGPVVDVPVADVIWQLVVPDGMRVVRGGGSVSVPHGMPSPWPLTDLLASVVPLGGGIRALSWGPLLKGAVPRAGAPAMAVDSRAPSRSRGLEAADEATPAAAPVPSRPAAVAGKLDQPVELPQAGSGPLPPPTAPPQPVTTTLQRTTWEFEGVRSLPIALEDSGTTYRYESFGGDTRLVATLVDERRIVSGAVGLVAVVALCGLALIRCRWKTRLIAAMLLLLAAVATPVGIELAFGIDLHAFFEPACLVVVGWLPVFAVLDALRFVGRGGLSGASRGAMAVAVLAILGSGESLAEEGRGQVPIPIDMERLLETLRPTKPVAIPDDAVVIPYDPEQPGAAEQAEKVLVPYEEYTRLKKLAADMAAGRQPGPESPPAPYAFGGARYEARLEDRGDLVVTGRVVVMIYEKGVVDVPLSLAGGVLASATLDDRPARLRLLGPDVGNAQPQAEPPVQQQAVQQREIQARPSPALAMLALEGVGRHELAVDVRFTPSQRGGWRRVEGSLPVAAATAVSLTVPAASTEVRLGGVQYQAIYETSRADEVIDTALQAEGLFSVEWRSRVAAATIDDALTVDSLGIFDVREDGLQLTWRLALDIRQGQRDAWRLLVPAEVLVEEVRGSNVRGWETSLREGRQQIDVTLLEPATGQAELIVRLSQEANLVFDRDAAVTLPFVSVPEAALHSGSVVIRRGPLIDLRVEQAEGLSREELPQEKVAAVLSVVRDESPLPLRPFQTYRFPSEQASLRLTAGGARAMVDVEGQTLVRIAGRETRFEALLACSVEARPLHALEVELPPQVELQAVSCPGLSSWSLENGGRRLRIDLADGALGRVPVTLRGRLGERAAVADSAAGEAAVDVAPFSVRGARRQSGEVVVQVDPSLSVATTDLVNAETIPLSRTFRWLSEPQRALARLALLYRGASFSARLQVARRQPVVSAVAVTNVRITPRDIEETMLLRFRVREAGIRDVAFLVAESMADAEVETPLLLEKQVEPVADEPGLVRMRLTFQDDVMGSLAVLLQNSRPLPEAGYRVPMVRIETGTTQHRYAVVETGGRDEVVVAANAGFRQLNRQAAEWRELVSILPGQTSMAYVAQSDAADPLLELSLRERAVVEAAGARIGLAITTLSVDAQGEYRGSQEYRVDNKTEQLLEVQLPPGATLWSAMVAGESVKPTPLPAAADGRHVGVPLIKTQAGDLDYGVVLTYGGTLGPIDSWQTVSFPLMTTRNINVEQSQVRLWLPKTHRWFEFGGTLRQADSADDLLADFMAYQNKKLERLVQVASSESNDLFSRVRASTNARQLGESLRGYRDAYRGSSRSGGTTKLQKAIEFNDSIVDEAKSQELPLGEGLELNAPLSNSLQLRMYFGQQDVQRGQNVVNELGANFPSSPAQAGFDSQMELAGESAAPADGRFNRQWFTQNRFGRSSDVSGEQDREAEQLAIEAEGRLGDVGSKRSAGAADPDDLTADFKGIERKLGLVMDAEQAEKAKQQLQQGRLAPESQLRDQVERYQQRLERQSRGLASLEVRMPERGQEFLFTTPRGDLEITARAIDARWIARGLRLAIVLGGGLGLLVVWSLLAAVWRRLGTRLGGLLLVLTGVASVATLVLPVVGIITAAVGGTLLVASFRRPRAATA